MHHELGVWRGVVVEHLPDPNQIVLALLGQRDLWPDPCMNKEEALGLAGEIEVLQEASVAVGHDGAGPRVHLLQPSVIGKCDAVRGERLPTAQPIMQPVIANQKMWIMPRHILQEPLKHPVMIAFEANPVAPFRYPLGEIGEHSGTLWPSINVIAQKHDTRITPAIGFNMCQSRFQQGKLAMNVSDGVGRSGHATSNSNARTCWNMPVLSSVVSTPVSIG